MSRGLRVVASGALVALAALFALGVVAIHGMGGRIETELLVYGDRVWVTLDFGRPRFLLMLSVPVLLFAAAVSTYVRRSRE